MVKPETFTFKNGTEQPRGATYRIGGKRMGAIPVKLERMSNGAWYVTASIVLEFNFNDGRKVGVNRQIRLRAAQEGKRPNPDPFGWKKKKAKATKKR